MSIFGRRMLDAADRLALPPPPPESENGAADMYATEEASFDTNMVIILAALLCTLIFALGLNSIVRCAIRFRRRLRSDGAGRGCRRPAGSGLKKNALRKIPVVVYGSDGAGIRPATECPICLGEFEDGERVRVLPECNHGFHVRCIDTWLVSHPSCPTCRHSLVEQPVPPVSLTETVT